MFSRSKLKVPNKKNGFFNVLKHMDGAAGAEKVLPPFVWPAVLVGCAAHSRINPEASLKAPHPQKRSKVLDNGKA